MIDISYQEILGAIAFLISIVGTVVYIRSILKGDTKPHLYTWMVFTILTSIAFFAQISDNAGPGAWMMGANAVLCFLIMLLCPKYGHKEKTKADKIALISSLFAIIPWLMLESPLVSVIMVSLIDMVAFFPTIRKSWDNPYQENIPNYMIQNLKNIIALFALTNFTITTSLYLISIFLVNSTLIGICVYRRRIIPNKQSNMGE
ncbi:MAG: hypothetical protein A3B66_04090 [Alphaproteobacteria bacterium RIFCSPHIGHO2_02_FULL_46_13]|nr:MAG: hypothetical protein A3B66_04090 [Alphaproteobacteria bacterium RIFCSPHIGHO2_02_FULL_46_13]